MRKGVGMGGWGGKDGIWYANDTMICFQINPAQLCFKVIQFKICVDGDIQCLHLELIKSFS